MQRAWVIAGVLAVTFLGGCGASESKSADKAQFCELARQRDAKQPEIDFDHATTEEIKSALKKYMKDVEDNVAEAKQVAPDDIRADFVQSVADAQQAAHTGDPSFFGTRASQRVGAYLEKHC